MVRSLGIFFFDVSTVCASKFLILASSFLSHQKIINEFVHIREVILGVSELRGLVAREGVKVEADGLEGGRAGLGRDGRVHGGAVRAVVVGHLALDDDTPARRKTNENELRNRETIAVLCASWNKGKA